MITLAPAIIGSRERGRQSVRIRVAVIRVLHLPRGTGTRRQGVGAAVWPQVSWMAGKG